MFELLALVVFFYVVWNFKVKGKSKAKQVKNTRPDDLKCNNDVETRVVTPPSVKIEHKKQSHLATENERKLCFALQKALPPEYMIHSQVSLMALVNPVEAKHNSKTWAKRMDFVITDKATKILAVIELDDSTHHWEKRKERDRYVNEVLEGHHKLVRFNTKRFYEPHEIAKVLEQETGIKCHHFEQVAV